MGKLEEAADAEFVAELVDQAAATVKAFGGSLESWPKDWDSEGKSIAPPEETV